MADDTKEEPDVEESPFHIVATIMIGEAAAEDAPLEAIPLVKALVWCYIPSDSDDREDLLGAVCALCDCEEFQAMTTDPEGDFDDEVSIVVELIEKLGGELPDLNENYGLASAADSDNGDDVSGD